MKKENEYKFIISGRGAGRNVSKVKQCNKCFTSIHCVDGTCPSAQYESICSKYGYDLASDMGLKMIKCSKCAYNTQQCTDCIFENTSDCYKRRENK